MAKAKFEDYRRIEICGDLITDTDGVRLISVDEDLYELDEVLSDMIGHTIEIKCTM